MEKRGNACWATLTAKTNKSCHTPVARFLTLVLKSLLPVPWASAQFFSYFCGARPKRPACFHGRAFLDLPFCDRYRALEMSASPLLPQTVTASPGSPSGVAKVHRDMVSGISKLASHTLSKEPANSVLTEYFSVLLAVYGPQHWWPGRSRFEIIVGAILTQNTSWKNVERAIANLRSAKLLSPLAIRDVHTMRLSACLRPSGYFRQKTKTLRTFVTFLFAKYDGSLHRLFATPTQTLREQLLGLRGIGPETADSILLYAGKHPVFVVDAYARRILERHGLAHPKASYDQVRATFEFALPRDQQLFNEFHALIVQTGKQHCSKTNPKCYACPLAQFLPGGSPLTSHNSPPTHP
jgi:endonuclease III related protein